MKEHLCYTLGPTKARTIERMTTKDIIIALWDHKCTQIIYTIDYLSHQALKKSLLILLINQRIINILIIDIPSRAGKPLMVVHKRRINSNKRDQK